MSSTWRLSYWYVLVPRKDGKPAKRVKQEYAWYTPLRTCQRCGLTSTPKRVQHRSLCYEFTNGQADLCMACWNVIRPMSVRSKEIYELGCLQRKLEREAKKCLRQPVN